MAVTEGLNSAGDKRVVCEKHGDIGTVDGITGNNAVCFTVGPTVHYFCLRCCEELLLEHLTPCSIEETDAA